MSIRTSYIPFHLCSPSRLCGPRGLHVPTTKRGFYRCRNVDPGRPCAHVQRAMCDRVCMRNARVRRAGGTGRHIIRGNRGMRAARDAGNYPQLSRAYTIHGASSTSWCDGDRLARLLDESRANLYAAPAAARHPRVHSGGAPPRPGILLRGDGDRRCVCEVNDIFQSASVSLVPASLSLPLSFSLFSLTAHGRLVAFECF